mgnify:CR=1 FL=1
MGLLRTLIREKKGRVMPTTGSMARHMPMFSADWARSMPAMPTQM